jgi:hypothetical protein
MERRKDDIETAGPFTEQGKYRQAISCVHHAFFVVAPAAPSVFDVRFHTHLPY